MPPLGQEKRTPLLTKTRRGFIQIRCHRLLIFGMKTIPLKLAPCRHIGRLPRLRRVSPSTSLDKSVVPMKFSESIARNLKKSSQIRQNSFRSKKFIVNPIFLNTYRVQNSINCLHKRCGSAEVDIRVLRN